MTLAEIMQIPYSKANCWALVRIAAKELFGIIYPSYNCDSYNKRLTTATAERIQRDVRQSGVAIAGRAAFAYHGRLCVHTGIVVNADSREWILETDEPTGPVLTSIPDFERRYTRVDYYEV